MTQRKKVIIKKIFLILIALLSILNSLDSQCQEIKFVILDSIIYNDCSGYHQIPKLQLKVDVKLNQDDSMAYCFNYPIPNIISPWNIDSSNHRGFYYSIINNAGDSIRSYRFAMYPTIYLPSEGHEPLNYRNIVLKNDTSFIIDFYIDCLWIPINDTYNFCVFYDGIGSIRETSTRFENMTNGYSPIDKRIKSNCVEFVVADCREKWQVERNKRLGIHKYFFKLYPRRIQNKIYWNKFRHSYKSKIH